jgi:hypothetical protein
MTKCGEETWLKRWKPRDEKSPGFLNRKVLRQVASTMQTNRARKNTSQVGITYGRVGYIL